MVDKEALEKSILAEAPKQWAKMQSRKQKLNRGKAKWQRDLEDVDRRIERVKRRADDLRRQYMTAPALSKIQAKFDDRFDVVSNLVCPSCGEGNKGNKMNGKPWCIKCNSPLIAKGKVEKWKRLPTVKIVSKSPKDELRRITLNPDKEDLENADP